MPVAFPDLDAFLARWSRAGAGEMANSQSYLSELCDILGVPRPEPKLPDEAKNDYVFERALTVQNPFAGTDTRRIDLYKKGCFVLESKQGVHAVSGAGDLPLFGGPAPALKKGIGVRGTDTWAHAMQRAKVQAEAYAKALPADHGWPPFLIVVDVGYCIELWANFARDGKAYTQFPDRNHFRIFHGAADANGAPTLANPDVRKLLAQVWTEPMALDPSRHAARVTRDIAEKLAVLARSFDDGPADATAHWQAEHAAEFLMRCLFCMFAEDVGLLPKDKFRELLLSLRDNPAQAAPMLEGLWREMDKGTPFSTVLRFGPLREFNGKFFHDQSALPLTRAQLDLLIDAAKADWAHVEPAIFGTLLERALSKAERHKLGAHYTPRSYVERLVVPTVIEPLRADWLVAQQESDYLAHAGNREAAWLRLVRFHQDLCKVRVLDPACGSGNFLYVTLEQMKRLEGEVLQRIADARVKDGAGQITSKEGGEQAVHPRQFFGIEVNPRAAVIAEMVLWIGYLQWQARTLATTADPELRDKLARRPVLEDLRNIECRDAVLAWDQRGPKVGEDGKVVTEWDGVSVKVHPVTGLEVPDDSKRKVVEEIVGARKAEWPVVEFVVGNPPFVANKKMRQELGLGYVDALRSTYDREVPDGVDYVMYWWDRSARPRGETNVRRFGLITTNSITQESNRQLVEAHLRDGLSLHFAVPDHPWGAAAEDAGVRVSMTVASRRIADPGRLLRVTGESVSANVGGGPAIEVEFQQEDGVIHSDLRVGPNLAGVVPLQANLGLAFTGMYPLGQGFVLSDDQVAHATGNSSDEFAMLRPFCTANDLTKVDRKAMVIDLWPRDLVTVRREYPALFQWLHDRVLPDRALDNRENYRTAWWLFAEPRPGLRAATSELARSVVVPRTAKYFSFIFRATACLPDSSVVAIATDDAWLLGVLSSRPHRVWALAKGGTLENRPRYQHKSTFRPFPFPTTTPDQQARIRDLGERLDAHRKRQQALHPHLTLTGMYNVLQKLRADEPLTVKDKAIHEQGLCSVLRQIHDDLDAAVFAAYGWSPALTDEELLQKLVDLNAERADEERRGIVRWLRPEFQDPARKGKAVKAALDLGADDDGEPAEAPAAKKRTRPKNPLEAVTALQQVFAQARQPMTAQEVAELFDGWDAGKVELGLRIAEGYGEVRDLGGRWVRG